MFFCVEQVYHTDDKMVDTTNWPSCTCERGKYRCHHMAVAMIHANRTVSCTDKSCSWSKPKKSTSNQAAVPTISEMYPDKKTISYLDRDMNEEDVDWFYNKLQEKGRYCSMLWLLSKEPVEPNRPAPTIEDMVTSEAFLQCDMPIVFVLNTMAVTREQILRVEEVTRGQTCNDLWNLYRVGRVTASKFGSIIKCMQSNKQPTVSLMKSLLGEYNVSGAKSIQWGSLHEQTALELYVQHCGVNVQKSGLWLYSKGFCGASPDGIVDENCILEIKCPYSIRDSDVSSHIGPKFFLTKGVNGLALINMQNEQGFNYYHQIQGCMWLSGRKSCDLLVWTPQELFVTTVHYDEHYELKHACLLEQFFVKHFLPAFLAKGK